MAPIGLQDAPRENDRKWHSFCGGYLGVLVLAELGGCSFARFFAESSVRRSLQKSAIRTDNSGSSAHFARAAVLGWAGGDSRSVNNTAGGLDIEGVGLSLSLSNLHLLSQPIRGHED